MDETTLVMLKNQSLIATITIYQSKKLKSKSPSQATRAHEVVLIILQPSAET